MQGSVQREVAPCSYEIQIEQGVCFFDKGIVPEQPDKTQHITNDLADQTTQKCTVNLEVPTNVYNCENTLQTKASYSAS